MSDLITAEGFDQSGSADDQPDRPVPRSQVNAAISGFSSPEQAVRGAGGRISFDNSGNRTGDGPPVVRICPMARGTTQPGRVPSVTVRPGEPFARCP